MENRDQQMAFRALKMKKLEKEILLLDKQLMWPSDENTNVFLYITQMFNLFNLRSDDCNELLQSYKLFRSWTSGEDKYIFLWRHAWMLKWCWMIDRINLKGNQVEFQI